MKSLSNKLRDPDYNGLGMNQALLNQAALNIESLQDDYSNLLNNLEETLITLDEQVKIGDALATELAMWKQANVTAAELKLILEMRAIKEKHHALIGKSDPIMPEGGVFAGPVEDMKWPEDSGQHPQRGLAK